MNNLVELLHQGNYSCVIANGDEVRKFGRRGVIDIYELLLSDPKFLKGARVADKVVGKAAATLMVKGEISELYADVISERAIAVLNEGGVAVIYGKLVSMIDNRTKDGYCPLETLTKDSNNIDQSLGLIAEFISKMKMK